MAPFHCRVGFPPSHWKPGSRLPATQGVSSAYCPLFCRVISHCGRKSRGVACSASPALPPVRSLVSQWYAVRKIRMQRCHLGLVSGEHSLHFMHLPTDQLLRQVGNVESMVQKLESHLCHLLQALRSFLFTFVFRFWWISSFVEGISGGMTEKFIRPRSRSVRV